MNLREDAAFALLASAVGIAEPYQWQWQAYRRLAAGDLPGSIVVPTAAGKTMFIVAFVAALATQAASGKVSLPRRLVHVVNRRILVDEATRLAQRLRDAILTLPELRAVQDALVSLSFGGVPLAVSALRGGIEDDGAWSIDPSTPAVILATPDMLGSRLLFRGYGLGRSRAATHAGLLGCDTLVVHDEAHLAPAFTTLLRQIEVQTSAGAAQIHRPPLRVVEMTATLAGQDQTRPLLCDVAHDQRLRARMSAAKALQIIDVRDGGKTPQAAVLEALGAQALAHRFANKAVAIFVNSPALAEKLANRIHKAGVLAERVMLLTGTLRGYERERLSASQAFRRFDPGAAREEIETAYFIATSAGEIGLDIDADIGLFDLSTIDRFIQRCGRVNRRGLVTGEICLIHVEGADLPQSIAQRALSTLHILLSLQEQQGIRDASPLALSRLSTLPEYAAAMEPQPAIRMLEPQAIAMLAMTSLRLDEIQCPAPDVYIHGLVEDEAQVQLAWRHLPQRNTDLGAWLESWPLSPVETARLPLEAAQKLLRTRLSDEHVAAADARVLAVALDAQGLPLTGTALRQGDNIHRWINQLRAGQTVLLDCALGGLNAQGLPSSEAATTVPDVSAAVLARSVDMPGAAYTRLHLICHCTDDETLWSVAPQREETEPDDDLESPPPEAPPSAVMAATVPLLMAQWFPDKEIVFHDAPASIDGSRWRGGVQFWLSDRAIRTPDSGDAAALSTRDRGLQEHLDLTARAAHGLCQALRMPAELHALLVQAGAEHDRGKQWPQWQQAIGNTDASRPLGKSAQSWFNSRINDGYRHELGSLVDLGCDRHWVQSQLIATHHGWGRPTYRPSALNKFGCAAVATEVAHGFSTLQRSIGPWASCYLEGLLKAADVLAETQADALLARGPGLPQTLAATLWSPSPARPAQPAQEHITLALDISNFGEYLAALGLVALLDRQGYTLTCCWHAAGFSIQGVNAQDACKALQSLSTAQAKPDATATVPDQQEAPYPPLLLHMPDGTYWALNHWLDQRLRASSGWKLGAGQTTALGTLNSLLAACQRSWAHPDLAAADLSAQAVLQSLWTFGGRKVQADASKFRFDAATSWAAQDAGFSLNEAEHFKSTRPWVELLSALGLQHFFLPPADATRRYYTWDVPLSPTLALAAAKGLLPQCSRGYEPVIVPSGKMKDVFTSKLIYTKGSKTWQSFIRLV